MTLFPITLLFVVIDCITLASKAVVTFESVSVRSLENGTPPPDASTSEIVCRSGVGVASEPPVKMKSVARITPDN